jgi:hypothetical protein
MIFLGKHVCCKNVDKNIRFNLKKKIGIIAKCVKMLKTIKFLFPTIEKLLVHN